MWRWFFSFTIFSSSMSLTWTTHKRSFILKSNKKGQWKASIRTNDGLVFFIIKTLSPGVIWSLREGDICFKGEFNNVEEKNDFLLSLEVHHFHSAYQLFIKTSTLCYVFHHHYSTMSFTHSHTLQPTLNSSRSSPSLAKHFPTDIFVSPFISTPLTHNFPHCNTMPPPLINLWNTS